MFLTVTPLDGTSDNGAVAEATCGEAGGTWVSAACTAADITSDNAALCNDAGGAYDSVSDSCSVDITSDNQTVCEAANGTWVLHGPEAGTCTPATVAARDCFREGACGVDGWNLGDYQGGSVSSTGCADTAAGSDSYVEGTSTYNYIQFVPPYPPYDAIPAAVCN